jgi:hypothetical protein
MKDGRIRIEETSGNPVLHLKNTCDTYIFSDNLTGNFIIRHDSEDTVIDSDGNHDAGIGKSTPDFPLHKEHMEKNLKELQVLDPSLQTFFCRESLFSSSSSLKHTPNQLSHTHLIFEHVFRSSLKGQKKQRQHTNCLNRRVAATGSLVSIRYIEILL